MFQSFSFPRLTIAGAKQLTLNSALAFGLLFNPYAAQAEQDSAKLNLQAVAASSAQELGGVIANGHWTRIEFSNTFTDPIVVVEPLTASGNSPYIVGIRNVDSSGFEINLKGCNNADDAPLQENINYSVIENSQLSTAQQTNNQIKQHYAWGECSA